MFERIQHMLIKELIQVFRDPRLARIVLVAPVLQLLAFGYVVSTDVSRIPTFVVDQDRTRASRDLVQTLAASGYFRIVGRSDRPRDLADVVGVVGQDPLGPVGL